MKTTVIVEEELSTRLAQLAKAMGRDVNDLANDSIRHELERSQPPVSAPSRPFVQRTCRLEFRSDLDLDHALALAGQLEDVALMRKVSKGR